MSKLFSTRNLLAIAAVLAVAVAAHFGYAPGLTSPDDGMMIIGIGMAQMTPALARVVDPILSTIARGYKNLDFIGNNLFPVVPVGQRGGQIITFGREDFAIYDTQRAPGTNTKRIHVGYTGAAFALKDYSLEGAVPIELQQESASASPSLDLGRVAVNKVQNIMALQLEKAQADLATTAANYNASYKNTALAGATLWSDITSDPIANVETGKEAIRVVTGRRPNTMVIGPKVWNALQLNTKILARVTTSGGQVQTPTTADLARIFGVARVFVGEAIYTDASGAFVDMWGKNAVLAYTELSSLADMGTPTFGYTYRLSGYPLVEVPYMERNPKSWFYPVTDVVAPVIAGASGAGGYLISPAVA